MNSKYKADRELDMRTDRQNMEVTGKDTNGDRKPQHLDPLFKDGNNPDEDKGFEHLNKSDICIL